MMVGSVSSWMTFVVAVTGSVSSSEAFTIVKSQNQLYHYSKSSSSLKMSSKPEIEVISQPDDEFLTQKGYVPFYLLHSN